MCVFRLLGEKNIKSAPIALTICRTSVETICIQHMAVARAHTMVEMTLRAHTLNSSSWRRGGAEEETVTDKEGKKCEKPAKKDAGEEVRKE